MVKLYTFSFTKKQWIFAKSGMAVNAEAYALQGYVVILTNTPKALFNRTRPFGQKEEK
jgi:hypothetical protein